MKFLFFFYLFLICTSLSSSDEKDFIYDKNVEQDDRKLEISDDFEQKLNDASSEIINNVDHSFEKSKNNENKKIDEKQGNETDVLKKDVKKKSFSSDKNDISFFDYLDSTNFKPNVKNRLKRIFQWSTLQKNKKNVPQTKTLLYPFGGGDILYPLVFFNEIDDIVIVGLEPAGKVLQKDSKLHAMHLNLKVLYEVGYFRTRQMEMISKIGVLSLIYHQLKDFKADIIKIKCFKKGFKLIFKLNGRKKTLRYYSLNLNNANTANWENVLKKFDNFTLFLKSASYILQQENFENIKNFLIVRSKVILQDDSGFNYKFILNNNFKVFLYGYYFAPLITDDKFDIYFQRPLMNSYLQLEDDVNIFDIGYNEPNWLLALKDEYFD